MNRPDKMGNEMEKESRLTYKLEVMQVVGVDVRRWVDLQRVIVLVGVLKEAVHWIKNLVRTGQNLYFATDHRNNKKRKATRL